jgi:hypothetical protein
MAGRLRAGGWLVGSFLGAVQAAFLIGLLGMLTKVLLTGNGVAYFASVAAAILAIPLAGPGIWLTLAAVFRLADRRDSQAGRVTSFRKVGLLWGLGHSVVAVVLCGIQMVPVLATAGYWVSIVTGTVATAAMIYLPPAPDHIFILLSPVVAGWLAGALFGALNRTSRGSGHGPKPVDQVTTGSLQAAG